MSRHVDTGSTDQTIVFWAFDADGAAVEVTTSDAVSYRRDNNGREGTPVALTLVARTVAGTHRDSAITYKGDGKHEVDLPDAAVAADGELTLEVTKSGVASVYVERLELGAGGGDAEQATSEEILAVVETIASQTGQITGARLSVSGAVTPGGTIQIIKGKDYKNAASNGIARTITDAGATLYARLTSGTLAASKSFGASRENGDAVIAGTIHAVTAAGGVTTITISIDADELPDTLDEADDYTYQIQRVTSDGDKVVEVSGRLSVVKRTV
jgi:hypothetical protein